MLETIYTRLAKPKHFYSNPGKRIHDTHILSVGDDGKKYLKKTGKVDVYRDIQSYADSCDIHLILDRYMKGDVEIINQVSAIYGDVTQMPKTLAEAYKKIVEGENYFAKLPIDIKNHFNNNPGEFFASIGTPEFDEFISKFATRSSSPIPDNKDTVKESEVTKE